MMTVEDKARFDLEQAITAAVKKFEADVAQRCIGISMQRVDEELTISAIIIPYRAERRRAVMRK